jgi:hypothetical protein
VAKLIYRVDSELGIFDKLSSITSGSSKNYLSVHRPTFDKVYSTLRSVRAKLAASMANPGPGGIILDPSLDLLGYKELSDTIETQDGWLMSIYVEELLSGMK